MIACAATVATLFAAGMGFAQSLTVYVGSRVDTLDPHHTITFAGHAVADTLHQGLLQYQSDGNLGPGLAQGWDVSRDGLTYTFTLKPGLTWSDGKLIEARDIAAGLTRALDPARPSPFARKLYPIANAEAYATGTSQADDILGVSVIDARTIVLKLTSRNYDFLHVLSHPVSKPAPYRNPDLISDGQVTSAAYTVVNQSSDGLVMTSRGRETSLVFQTVNSVEQALQMSKSSGPFVTNALPIVSLPQTDDRLGLVREEGGQALYAYAVNLGRSPFDKLEVRHALAMAVDRANLLDTLSIDSATMATQFVSPSAMTYGKSYEAPFASLTFEEREAVAEALLAEQGFAQGATLSVRLRIPEGDMHRAAALVIVDMWAAIGIDTDIISAPFPEHWDAVERGDFDIAYAPWPSRRNTPRGSLDPLSMAAGPWNFSRYSFSEFDERLARAAQSAKGETRAGYYREAEKALIEDQSLLALFFYRPLALVSPEVMGWQTNASGLHPLSNLSIAQ